jgi:hypothetical protein
VRQHPRLLRQEAGMTLPFFPPDLFEVDRDALLKLLYEIGTAPEQRFILGPRTAELERALAEATGAAEAVACGSGTGALVLAVHALGLGPGDEVIVPAFCCQPVASSVANLGATPVFADVNPWTMVIDPADVERLVTERTSSRSWPTCRRCGRSRAATGWPSSRTRRSRRAPCSTACPPAAGATWASSPSSRSRRSAPPARAAWC